MAIHTQPEPSQRTVGLVAAGAIGATIVMLGLIFGNLYNIENPDHSGHFPFLASALIWIFVGVMAWQRWPRSRLGPLLIATGFAHYGYAFGLIPTTPTWLISWFLGNTVIILVAYDFLSYPAGRLRNAFDLRLYQVVFAWWVVSGVLGLLATNHELNPLFVVKDEGVQSSLFTALSAVTGILTLIVAVRVVQHWQRASAVARPAYVPVVLALVPYIALEAAGWLERGIGENVISDAAFSLLGFFIQSVAFAVAVLYVLLRVAPETVEAASEPALATA
jgi:hypothetical protein